MALEYTIRPISDRTAFTGPPAKGPRNPFEASWSSTRKLLEHELRHLDAERVVLELDVVEKDLRLDGTLRANAAPTSPAVRLAFDSRHGPLVYATNRYGWTHQDRFYVDGWQANVRAIALGLEALRRVDRYGISRRGEQYRGYKAIEGAAGLTTEAAVEIIDRESRWTAGGDVLHATQLGDAARAARAATHPDRHDGDRTRYDAVDQAVQVLTRAGLIT